ncbi:fused signal recognition particle receptor [Candidatus Nanopelagicus abundans]|uniref:Signal recognition particle receptor FtsY n=1 Tax=Candidatus Nanopelagicus abundans TaxID=1884916 RepID=A0A249L4S0_9ACTN|nr:signal recognition particle-docking protein FtsY [Candidatus Nanopelagicus abundans]ASY24017.1 fused signal recognition particle receptor [Candidatus Nanopelagicus abundans]
MSLFKRLFTALRTGSVSSDEWDQIRSTLIASDLGVKLVDEVIEKVKSAKPDDAVLAITTHVKSWLSNKSRELFIDSDRLNTVLIVGVNGTGKTTSTAKLANRLTKSGSKVLLAAADTFRAAATEQLQTWAGRIPVEIVTGEINSDPASVAFSAATKAKAENFNYLLIDTAGRLHTKQDLMDELGKVIRVISKQSPVDEILLVIDATTGQNGINQAKIFIEAVGVTGFIITKLDGSAKGGIALAIEKQTGLPIKLVGTGEQITDLDDFDSEAYIAGLFE